MNQFKSEQCPYCGKTKSKSHTSFNKLSLKQHIKDKHLNEPRCGIDGDYALEMADMLAGDESDGVWLGIAYQFGYFG